MLTQSEADALIAMPKRKADEEIYDFPHGGEYLRIPIVSEDGRESFLLDVSRGKIRINKCTFQERYRDVFILVRLDIGGAPHTNPGVASVPLLYLEPYNGQKIQCPHLHIYVEGFNHRWAVPAPVERFPQVNDLGSTLDDFFSYCNIVDPPTIQRGLSIC